MSIQGSDLTLLTPCPDLYQQIIFPSFHGNGLVINPEDLSEDYHCLWSWIQVFFAVVPSLQLVCCVWLYLVCNSISCISSSELHFVTTFGT